MKSLEEIQKNKLIGRLNNHWRKRDVFVYQHEQENLVYSIGFDRDRNPPVICVEPKNDYKRVLDLFPETAIYK